MCLGEQIFFPELITKKISFHNSEVTISVSRFLSKTTLELVHRMVQHRYSTYKNVLKLRIPDEITPLLTKKPKRVVKPEFQKVVYDETTFQLTQEPGLIAGQQLIVFPDLRTMSTSSLSAHFLKADGTIVLHGGSTTLQKTKAFRAVKHGLAHTLVCTYSQIFQDRKSLMHIVLVDPHKRYYKNQQDPRYDTVEVVKKMEQAY